MKKTDVWVMLMIMGSIFILAFSVPAWAGKKFALLIGIDDYSLSGLPSLEGPQNDLQLMEKVLRDKFQLIPKHIRVLKGRQATHKALEKAFADLADTVGEGDFVYIHYSGHGSQVPDLDGDEYPGTFDQTWVPYGSRCPTMKGKNRFDISDDELYRWLKPIANKKTRLVFVSDSCHAAGVTRGNAGDIRSVPADPQYRQYQKYKPHQTRNPLKGVIRVGAVQAPGIACEGVFGGKVYGLFSWCWAGALFRARPGDTWGDLFKRAAVTVTNLCDTQRPQFLGDTEQHVFGGDFKPMPPRVAVRRVWGDRNQVLLDAGALAGMTVGSVFRLYVPGITNPTGLPLVEITQTWPFYSRGTTVGLLEVGDLLVEVEHRREGGPLPVFIDAPVMDGMKEELLRCLLDGKGGLPGFQRIGRRAGAAIVLGFRQPGRVCLSKGADSFFFTDVCIPFTHMGETTANVRGALTGIARMQEIIDALAHIPRGINLQATVWRGNPGKNPGLEKIGILEPPDMEPPDIKRDRSRGQNQIPVLPRGCWLSFKVRNHGCRDYYMHLLNILDNGRVSVVFPGPGSGDRTALLPAGREVDLGHFFMLRLNRRGKEVFKLVVSEQPVPLTLWEQGPFTSMGTSMDGARGTVGQADPLALVPVRGMGRGTVKRGRWGAIQFMVTVRGQN